MHADSSTPKEAPIRRQVPAFSWSLFDPLLSRWFQHTLGEPTAIQRAAWPLIAAGAHVLLLSPTGSGKTLAAFFWAIHQLAFGPWHRGGPSVLYVSPLKALNNDIQENLRAPLAGIRRYFADHDRPFPAIKVATRSGDTSPAERRRMLRRPPDILITTPESLNIMLTARSSRRLFTAIKSVILDEIHALFPSKRGSHLLSAVERLVLLSGEFQRVALSATIQPPEEVAAFVGGYALSTWGESPGYTPRDVRIVAAPRAKTICLRTIAAGPETPNREALWADLVERLLRIITANRSTLIFANSRRMTEKLARLINERAGRIVAYGHHGSLSRDIRLEVESKLKQGDLQAIVATNSLELGIDIGHLDEVVLVQPPLRVASAIQRVGRSGHRVAESSRGRLFPLHGHDYLLAAVLGRAAVAQDIAPVTAVTCPLDVLCQVVLSMCAQREWPIADLFARLRACYSFHGLTCERFHSVVEMLAGRHRGIRVKALPALLSVDRLTDTVRAKARAVLLLYRSGGTIPDRGYYTLRLAGTRAKIGELDEEFVWERKVADTFALGTRCWKIQRVTDSDVEVTPAAARPGIIPFWRAESRSRSWHFSRLVLEFLTWADSELPGPALAGALQQDFFLDPAAARRLQGYLEAQKQATRRLPQRNLLVVERLQPPGDTSQSHLVLHTFWGESLNRPFAYALAQAWREARQTALDILATNDCVILRGGPDLDVNELLELAGADDLERLVRTYLPGTGFFGAHFRENAARGLLLPKSGFNRRQPLWMNRLRARKLLHAVAPLPGFPLLEETMRSCLRDACDLPSLGDRLKEIADGRVKLHKITRSRPSPFAKAALWYETNQYMYQDDTPGRDTPSLSLLPAASDITVDPDQAAAFTRKLQRSLPGYAPRSAADLLDWLRDRLVIPEREWRDLLALVPEVCLEAMADKIACLHLPGQSPARCAKENIPLLCRCFHLPAEWFRGPSGPLPDMATALTDQPTDCAALLGQWLSYYGPLSPEHISARLGLAKPLRDALLQVLQQRGQVVSGSFFPGNRAPMVCHRDNLAHLLRWVGKLQREQVSGLPISDLPLFLAWHQGLTRPGTEQDLPARLEQLLGVPLPAAAWERYVLPARITGYHGRMLDNLVHGSRLGWYGCGKRQVCFAFPEDVPLFLEQPEAEAGAQARGLFADPGARYDFFTLLRSGGLKPGELHDRLWQGCWQSAIANDSFAPLREAMMSAFAPPVRGRVPRRGRWASPAAGGWRLLHWPRQAPDNLERQEMQKLRVRQVLQRYGIIFRELLTRELPLLRWSSLLPALRLMELSGEVMCAPFFNGIQGLQFMYPATWHKLQQDLPRQALFWLNALDPASACGLNIPGLTEGLPARQGANLLVYLGAQPALVLGANGRLDVHLPPAHPRLPDCLACLRLLLQRDFDPLDVVTVERVNGTEARHGPYAGALRAAGFHGVTSLELRLYG